MRVPRSFELSLDDVRVRIADASAAEMTAAGESVGAVNGVVDEDKDDVATEDGCCDCAAIPAVEGPVATTDATPFAVMDCLFNRCKT